MEALAEEQRVIGAVGYMLQTNTTVNEEDAVPRHSGKLGLRPYLRIVCRHYRHNCSSHRNPRTKGARELAGVAARVPAANRKGIIGSR